MKEPACCVVAFEWVRDEMSFHNFNASALMFQNEACSVGGVNNTWATCAVL